MGLVRGKRWWWEFFKELLFNLHTTVKGSITLGYGVQTLTIPIDRNINPLAIYVNCQDNDVPVCVGSISTLSAMLNDDHTFTLYANIASNSCTVGWLIEYDPIID